MRSPDEIRRISSGNRAPTGGKGHQISIFLNISLMSRAAKKLSNLQLVMLHFQSQTCKKLTKKRVYATEFY
jgi:hypothetical protein